VNPVPVMRPCLGQREAEATAEAVLSGWVAQGPRVAQFEEAFARAIGVDHAVALSSCTAALHLALLVLGIGPGDEVVVPSLSFIATTNAVRYVGAEPVFADVDPTTQCLTAQSAAEVMTDRTRAVIVVDQGGVPADIEPLERLCDTRRIAVIDDAACAAGSSYKGQPVGRRGVISTFSFHPRKIITTGEGGMLVTADEALAERARCLREHAMSVSAAERHRSRVPLIESYLEVGWNFRMTDVQAAVGLVQLERLGEIVERRRELARCYQERLAGLDVTTAADPSYGRTNFQAFWVLLGPGIPVSRDGLLAGFAKRGISPRRGIMAAHLEPPYRGCARLPLPITERLTRESIILPLYHDLTEADQDRVVAVLDDAATGRLAA